LIKISLERPARKI